MKLPRLTEWRERRGYSTPAELAGAPGVDRSTVWRIEERGQGAHPRTAGKLAEALGIQVEDLMGFRDAGSPSGGGRSSRERPLFGADLKEALREADERDGWRGQQKVLQEQMAKVGEGHPLHPVYEALHAELEMLEGRALTGAVAYGRAAGRFYLSLPRAALRLMLEGKPVPAWLQKEAYRELAS